MLAAIACKAGPVPTKASCIAAIARAEAAAEHLPKGGMARSFAESDLVQARSEAGNGEFDDCLEFAEKAEDEVRHPHHALRP